MRFDLATAQAGKLEEDGPADIFDVVYDTITVAMSLAAGGKKFKNLMTTGCEENKNYVLWLEVE